MKASNGTVPLFTEVGVLIKKRMQRALPLTFSQMQALWFAAEHPGASMQDVATYFKIAAPSATFLVDELVREGYLARRPAAGDRRKVALSLTPKGKRNFKTLELKRKKVLDAIFKPLSAADRAELNRILTKIIAHA